ncbi:MAG TPA: class I SAM-dependent methyltransferase [Candidatus Marinimicrobia bacterium]|nr:class I SAM-dependent methyltransferase [Candidatus Neomarinimicrobiota bacterium]
MMNQDLKGTMLEYYTHRAAEFDEKYKGRGPASILDPQAYQDEVKILSDIVRATCSGNLLDMACGTAFWLPHYAGNCSHITLFDQSEGMLSHARDRAVSLGIIEQTAMISGDALSYQFSENTFDMVLVAFLISHFTDDQEARFFRMLKSIIKPNGKVLVLDSVWSDARGQARKKEGIQSRSIGDGREFQVYKKYFTEQDLSLFIKKHGIGLSVGYFGRLFFAANAVIKK